MLNDFYTIAKVQDHEKWYQFEIELNPSHPLYKGHFPKIPVMPGVCMLQIIKECAEKALNKSVFYSGVSSCKFLSVINPQINNILLITISTDEIDLNTYSVSAKAECAGTVCLKLKADLVCKYGG
jgi:3-hydroxymyristoyl/3-hydroxydecanoyl-(acyl carrier protein) dehydratases